MVCTQCDEDKKRFFNGKLTAKGRKIYHDKSRRQWYGRVCPDCRYSPKEVETLSHRKCPQCKGPMSVDRYFNCLKCVPELPSEDEYEAELFTSYSSIKPGISY